MNERFALVTGASGGIGFELAKCAASDGYHVLLVARSEDQLKTNTTAIARNYGVKALYFKADLSDYSQVVGLSNYIRENELMIEILVNNAGFGDYGWFKETSWQKEYQMMQLNVLALTHLTKEIIPSMIKIGQGRILNISSVAGFFPGPKMAVYSATKAFVSSFSRALNLELKSDGITSTVLCPGPTRTGFAGAAGMSESKLFNTMPLASAEHVARKGYKAMMKGKAMMIPGFLNKLMICISKLIPVKWLGHMTLKIMKD